MKTKILVLLLLVTCTKNFGQTLSDLKKNTEKMYEASYKMDFNTLLDLTYPKVFEIASREDILSTMKETFKNEMMTISFVDSKVNFTYGDVKETDNKKIVLIKYNSAVRMIFKAPLDADTAAMMTDGMKAAGKYDSVVFEADTNSLLLKGPAMMIGVADASSKNQWTFINYDSDAIFDSVLNANVKAILGL